MKALITGAAGFVGPHLQAELRTHGDAVVGVDRKGGPDLLDPDGWIELFLAERPDVVYHLAGFSDVGASWRHPHTTFDLNIIGTAAVLEAATQAQVSRCVVISSADVYGVVSAHDLPITESEPLMPRSPYGASKRCAEDLAFSYFLGRDLETVVVRPFNHLGPGQSARFAVAGFAHQVANAERHGGGQILHGDLSAQRDFTDVRDVVRAYRMLATDGEPGEVYNVCSGVAVPINDVLDQLVGLADAPIQTQLDESRLRPVELPVLRGSAEKIHRAVGWQPHYPLTQTLRDVLHDARNGLATRNETSRDETPPGPTP